MIVVGFAVTVNDEARGTIRNVAIVNGDETNETENPVVIFEKSVEQTEPLHEGDTIDYTITIENTGDVDAIVKTVTDEIPEGTTYVEASANNDAVFEENTLTWSDISLEKGQKVELTFQVTVNELLEGVYSLDIINVAVVDGEETNEVENEVVKPHITRLKENLPKGNVHEGETITYVITAGNDGTEAKTIVVEDAAPAGTTLNTNSIRTPEGATLVEAGEDGIKWTVTLEPKQTKYFTFTVTVNELEENVYGLSIPNTAIVDEEPTNEVENTVVKPALNAVKDNSPKGNVHENDEITYTISVDNKKGTEAIDIVVEDAAPAGTTLVADSIVTPEGATYEPVGENGVKWTMTLVAGAEAQEFKFTVTVNELEENVYTLDIPNTATVNEEPTNEVENTVVKPALNAVKDNSPKGNVHENDEITYTISVDNKKGTEAIDIVVEDAAPAGTTLVADSIVTPEGATYEPVGENGVKWTMTLVAGAEAQEFKFTVTVNELEENVYTLDIPNTATVNEEPTNEVENTVVKPALNAVKDNSPKGNVHENDEITYTISVDNKKGTEAIDIVVEDAAPAGTTLVADSIVTPEGATYEPVGENGVKWTMTLVAGAEAQEFKFTVTVNELEENVYTLDIPNTATVNEEPTNEVENTVVKPALNAVKDNSPKGNVHENDEITYTISVDNKKGTEAIDIVVEDAAPAGTTLVADSIVTPEGATYEAVGENGVKWTMTLEAGAEVQEFKFIVTVDELEDGVYSLTIPNTATVNEEPTNEVENNVIKSHINQKTKSSVPVSGTEVENGDTITYTITVTNDGTDSEDVLITDAIPAYTELIEGSISNNGTLSEDGTTISWNVTVPEKQANGNDGKISVSFKVKAKGHAGDVIENTAYVTYDGKEPENTETTEHPIKDEVTITSTSKSGKNIIMVLDLSSSMLQAKKGDLKSSEYDTSEYSSSKGYGNNDYIYPHNTSNCVELPESKLAYAKTAIKEFAEAVMNDNPDNRLTLITFNYSSVKELQTGTNNGYSWYYDDYNSYKSIIGNYVGTKTLINEEDSLTDFCTAVDNIRIRSRYLLTNMRKAIEYTQEVVADKISDGKEIDVIFFGDGKPSWYLGGTREACTFAYNSTTKIGFFNEATTSTKIAAAGSAIRNTAGVKLFTVEYLVPEGEQTDANEAFTAMTGVTTQDNQTRFLATADNVIGQLADIATKLDMPVTTHQEVETNGSNKGKVTIEIKSGNTLRISSVAEGTPVTLTVKENGKVTNTYTYTTVNGENGINNSDGKITYVEGNSITNSKFIIDTTKFPAGSSIDLNYYYKLR